MWFRKASPRRQAIREDVAEAESLQSGRGGRAPLVLIALVFFGIACLLQFWPGELLPFRVGQIAPTDVRSPVSFVMTDDAQTEAARDGAKKTSPAVLIANNDAIDHIRNALFTLKVDLMAVASADQLPVEMKARFPGLDNNALAGLRTMRPEDYNAIVNEFARQLYTMPIVSVDDYAKVWGRKAADTVKVYKEPNLDTAWNDALPKFRVLMAGEKRPEVVEALRVWLSRTTTLPRSLHGPVAGYLLGLTEPTYRFDDKLTQTLAERVAMQIEPQGDPVSANDIIVARGQPIDAKALRKMVEAQQKLDQITPARDVWLARLGRVLVVLMITAVGVYYIGRMNRLSNAAGRGWAVCGLLLAALALARAGMVAFPGAAYLLGTWPTLLAAIILVIAYNPRFAMGVAALHGLLVTFTLGRGLEFYLPLLVGVAVFCFVIDELRTRGKLIQIGVLAGCALFGAVWAVGLLRMVPSVWRNWIGLTSLETIWWESLWAAGSGVAVSMFALAILPSIERVFRITTAMTLLELCDANKPLLRRLSQEAPGTFNHSLTVGIMAEAAGNAIGANGLLCRVGAYYHDVGKLSKPQYFIENQGAGSPNRHDKLSPAMSLLIIVGHVKDGIELAREYGLPWIVHEFIAQHHGTTLVEYFFHAAKRKAEAEGDDAPVVSDTEFRYPGPRPLTPEAAIVMICDGCESAVRAIEEPTPGRIESAVHGIIMKRLMDGQFSECDLTLRDLSTIEETLIRSLAGVHHGRVAYPTRGLVSQPA